MIERKLKLFEEFDETTDNQTDNQTTTSQKTSNSPIIDQIGVDLTDLARNGKLDPVIGRDKEVEEVIWMLSRYRKSNPIIIGEAGIGKTAIVEGIAQQIIGDECPDALKGKRIIVLDLGTLKSFGSIEETIGAIKKEAASNPDIILFIDEIHLIVDKSAPMDIANLIKPALSRGEMRLIGATTLKEYKMSIEKDGALRRRFQIVEVEPTSIKDTIEILKKIQYKYEDFHNVKYDDDSIVACVKLADRYITDRFFPDKAIDLLDEVGAKARIGRKGTPKEIKDLESELIEYDNEDTRTELLIKKDFKKAKENKDKAEDIRKELTKLHNKYRSETVIQINKNMVANIIAIKTGIPAGQLSTDDNQKYLKLASEIKMEVIGQDDAINKIVKSIKRTATGLNDPNRPNGVFLLLGSTGVGKTHTVKMLAKHLYGSEKNLIRVDMSEYAEEHNVARMIGSPPGYVGHEDGGQLTEKVKHKPNSVILFDEIEKAHPKIFDVFLQIFDDGQLTDGQGTVVDFKNTTIIMTSNIGSKEVANLAVSTPKPGFGFNTNDATAIEASNKDKAKQVIMDELNKKFKPEFLNRIDDVVIFSKLSMENITKIVDIELAKVQKKLDDRKLTLELSPSFKELLIDKGYDKEMGARPLKRTIQNYLENPISDEILKGNLKEGDTIFVDYDKQKDETYINNNLVEEKKKYIITNFKKFNS